MRPALPLLVMVLGLSACGHTTIVTNDRSAKIYADGEFLGLGEARYASRTGIPRSMTITVKTPYAKVEREVSREFTATTAVLGAFTYMTGWFWGWQYPESVIVMLPERAAEGSGWDAAASAWDRAPAGWDAAAPGEQGAR